MLISASGVTKSERNNSMKKTAIVLMALIAAIAILFTACGKKMDNDMTTTLPETTVAPSVSVPDSENDTLTSEHNSTAYNGAPESTNQDSALGDAVENAAEGARDAADGIGDAAERAADDIGDANQRIADNVREAEIKSNAR